MNIAISTTPSDAALLDGRTLQGPEFVRQLQDFAHQHRAVHHPLFDDLLNDTLPDPAAALTELSVQYWGYSRWFQRYLLGAASQSESPAHRRGLLDNLREETGQLDADDLDELRDIGIDPQWIAGVGHPELYSRFLQALGHTSVTDDSLDAAVLTWRGLFLQLCGASGFAVAVGALGIATEGVVRSIYIKVLIRLNSDAPAALFAQIAAQIRRAIYAGELAVGHRLPSGRELATSLGVNMHTVLRAYSELRDEGLVEMRRGRGVRVVGTPPANSAILDLVDRIVDEAARVGLSQRELLELVGERHRLHSERCTS